MRPLINCLAFYESLVSITAHAVAPPWRKPVHGLATTVVRMRVWPLDLDLNRHVTNGRYFTLADVARMDFVLRTGAFRVALRHKAMPIVGDTWGKFRRELKLFEAFDVHTRILGWDHKWNLMEHRFVSNGQVVGVVVMRGLFRSAKGTLPRLNLFANWAWTTLHRRCRNG